MLRFRNWLTEMVQTSDSDALIRAIASNPTDRTGYGVMADYLQDFDEDGFRLNFLRACRDNGVACYPIGCFCMSPAYLSDTPRTVRVGGRDGYELAIHCVDGSTGPTFPMQARFLPEESNGRMASYMMETADMFNVHDTRFNDRLMDYLRCQSETHSNMYTAGSPPWLTSRMIERRDSQRANRLVHYFVF